MQLKLYRCCLAVLLSAACQASFAQTPKTPLDKTLFTEFTSTVDSNKLTSPRTLNAFFKKKISSYLSEASDLSLTNAFAILDNADGRLFLGGNFGNGYNKDSSRYLFTAGVKAKVEEGFFKIFAGGEFNQDIGVSFKVTRLGRGTIWFNKDPESQKLRVARYREYLGQKLINGYNRDYQVVNTDVGGLAIGDTLLDNFNKTSRASLKTKFADEEAGYISDSSLFNLAHDWWVSVEGYLPVTKSVYNTAPSLMKQTVTEQEYRPFELAATYNNLWVHPKGLLTGSSFFTVRMSALWNNNIRSKELEKYSYDQYLQQTGLLDTIWMAKLSTKDVYVGNYDDFLMPKLGLRLVHLVRDVAGISAALEQSFGKYNSLDWKIGLPVSLKDKEGKPKINFELQWREIRKTHSVGLSIGLPIGNVIF